MVQVDLITGFLGAGKTTFLRRYAAYLAGQGERVCILENDFGAVNVDAMLVQDLLELGCEIETISGGCDCDTHQRRMRTKLISMAMRGFTRVLVEPSGIFDVDEFFDVLRGDMSLVGTRPPTVDEYKQYESHHKRRLSMKPGITGLWQVSGRSDIEDFEEVVKLDVAYIDNWSLWGDVKILFKTIYVVFAGKGAK